MTRGTPRVQYARTYILLPPDADSPWARAVVEATWDKHRYTFGGSADDAGIGDLDYRRVIAINPVRWPNDPMSIEVFFQEHYPGVEYIPIEASTPEELQERLRELDEEEPDPIPPCTPLLGLHDEAGGQAMIHAGISGLCLVHWIVQGKSEPRDFSTLADAGITVIARLNWGYAGGPGTMPPTGPEWKSLQDAHVIALANTIMDSPGVAYWQLWNEPNNRQEWPGFDPEKEAQGLREYAGLSELSPEYIVAMYNRVWDRVPAKYMVGPPPLDPYFGPGSNNMDWWEYILDNIHGADALYLHCKTQTNNPPEMWSDEKFSHDPLKWQYYQARAIDPYLDAIKASQFAGLPTFVTEFNPQLRFDGTGGWEPENTEWLDQGAKFMSQRGLPAVLYRHDAAGDQAGYGLQQYPTLLNHIFSLCRE
jgi:hypothetical protein